jgi:hypothetical protein
MSIVISIETPLPFNSVTKEGSRWGVSLGGCRPLIELKIECDNEARA